MSMTEWGPAGLVEDSEIGWAFSGIRSRFVAEGTRNASDATYVVLKRAIDVFVASLALLVLAPVLLLAAIAIFLEDRGPILFVQMRVGKDGKPFPFYKFRSMVPNAEQLKDKLTEFNEATGPIFKMRNDPRITRVGSFLRKYSIDELPQLIHVLRGEMSLVGPRPQLPKEVQCYTAHQARRLAVQPGLVCLREVCGRCNLSFERWIELDLTYIQSRSLKTDLCIMLRTIPAVLRREGAY